MKNGCGQGKVLAAIAYCLYCEELFETLRRRHSGCWVEGHYRGIFGYSDDNWVLAPSLSALQDILKTCEEYAAAHNLQFSTDSNPIKCKTKCMAFLKKPRTLQNMYLCGNPLPWVDSLKHLGTTITNQINGCQADMKNKVGQYIAKNCSLCQEFFFSHPLTKIKVNDIYNCHFSSFQLWNLFSQGSNTFEATYNRSVRIMADLPLQTHRYLIKPLAGSHWKIELIRGYLGFIKRIKNSSKAVLKQLYKLASQDVRTVTGSHLRNILMMTNTLNIDQLEPNVVTTIDYHPVKDNNIWRINMMNELIDIKQGNINQPTGWSTEELDSLMNFVCTE